jgi:hypothetical protein
MKHLRAIVITALAMLTLSAAQAQTHNRHHHVKRHHHVRHHYRH